MLETPSWKGHRHEREDVSRAKHPDEGSADERDRTDLGRLIDRTDIVDTLGCFRLGFDTENNRSARRRHLYEVDFGCSLHFGAYVPR